MKIEEIKKYILDKHPEFSGHTAKSEDVLDVISKLILTGMNDKKTIQSLNQENEKLRDKDVCYFCNSTKESRKNIICTNCPNP